MSEKATLDEFAEQGDNNDVSDEHPRFGSLPNEWKISEIADIAEVVGGSTPSTNNEDYWGGGIPWATPTDITALSGNTISETEDTITEEGLESASTHLLPPNSVLMTSRATIGKCAINTVEMATNQGFKNLVPSDEIEYWHLYYRMLDTAAFLNSLGSGSTFDEVSKTEVQSVDIPIPPLPEQRKIATVLYTVDRAIEKTEEVIQQTERAKKGLVKEIVTGGIGAEEYQTIRVGPHEFEIPSHWDVVSISEACENLDSERIPVSKSNREDMQGEIPYYGASGCVDYVDDYLFNEPLILLAEDGENLRSRTQRVAFKVTGKTWVNNHAHVLRPRDGFELDYLVEYLERLDYRPYVSGSAQPKLNQTMLNKITIPEPPLEEQKKIASILNNLKRRISHETEYLDHLNHLKRGLMQDLLSGKVRTTDTNIEVPEEIAQHG